jgi:hypothetical protein
MEFRYGQEECGLRALITEELEQRQAWFQIVHHTSMVFLFRGSNK